MIRIGLLLLLAGHAVNAMDTQKYNFVIAANSDAEQQQPSQLTKTNYYMLFQETRAHLEAGKLSALKHLETLQKLDEVAECPGLVATDLLRTTIEAKNNEDTEKIIVALIKAGAKPEKSYGIDIIAQTIHNASTTTLPLFSLPKVTITPKSESIPPFFNCLFKGNLSVFTVLLEHQPDLVIKNAERTNPPKTYLKIISELKETKEKNPTTEIDASIEDLTAMYALAQEKSKILQGKNKE